MAHNVTKFAFRLRIVTLHGIMPNLFTFCNFHSASIANNFHEKTIVKFMCAQNQLLVRELIIAFIIVASEPDMSNIFILKLIERSQLHDIVTLAWSLEIFCGFTGLPSFDTRMAEILLTLWALFTLYYNILTESTG